MLSAHRDIKLRNEEVETLLLRWAEPLGAVNGLMGHGASRVFLRQAWKYLLQNHAHDTICGCSAEAVTRETLLRFEKAEQIGSRLKPSCSLQRPSRSPGWKMKRLPRYSS